MPITDNLLASYALSDLTDQHGAYNLTDNNGVTFEAGVLGNALRSELFGEETPRYASNTSPDLNPEGVDFEVTGWVKFPSFSGLKHVCGTREDEGPIFDTSPRGWRVETATGPVLRANVGTGSSSVVLSHSLTLSVDTWYFYSFRCNASTGMIELNVNQGTAVSVSATISEPTTSLFLIGAANTGMGVNATNALHDEINIFKGGLLTEAQRDTLYGNGTPPAYPFETIIDGPFWVMGQQVYTPGPVKQQIHTPGAVAQELFK